MSETTAALKICMCIDLDPDFYYLIQTYAERSGLQTMHVNRGQDALELARLQRPVVVFLEGDRPGAFTTWEVLKALKADQATREIPVILFSWINEDKHASEEGVDLYVQKPVMYVDFVDALAVVGVCQESQDHK